MDGLKPLDLDFRGWLAAPHDGGDLPGPLFPLRRFDPDALVQTLLEMPAGGRRPRMGGEFQVLWGGEEAGTVRATVDSRLSIIIERAVVGLDGGLYWACKTAQKMNVDEFARKEGKVARKAHSIVEVILREPLERASKENPHEIRDLLGRIGKAAGGISWGGFKGVPHAPPVVKRSDKDSWKVIIYPMEAGPGLVMQSDPSLLRQIEVQLEHDKESGMMPANIQWVVMSTSGNDWQQLPDHGVDFAPSQSAGEIVEAVAALIRWS